MHESGRDMLRLATRLDTQWKFIILGALTGHNKSRQRFTVDWFESADVWSLEGESKFGAVLLCISWFGWCTMATSFVGPRDGRFWSSCEACSSAASWTVRVPPLMWYYQAESVTKHQQPIHQFNINLQLQLQCHLLHNESLALWHPSVLDHRWIDVVLKIQTFPCSRFVTRRADP